MGKHIHKLSNINLGLKTADCLTCGTVKTRKVGITRVRCGEAIKEAKRKYYRLHAEEMIAKDRKRRHKKDRPKSCDVCGSDSSVICWDHCHKSGEFRGWLCRNCNLALGFSKDNPDLLRKLAAYLEK